jgi:hypothetical protein
MNPVQGSTLAPPVPTARPESASSDDPRHQLLPRDDKLPGKVLQILKRVDADGDGMVSPDAVRRAYLDVGETSNVRDAEPLLRALRILEANPGKPMSVQVLTQKVVAAMRADSGGSLNPAPPPPSLKL